MQLLHQSRSAEYRDPYGAVPAGTLIRLSLQVQPEEQDVRSVNLCYAYGLTSYQESRSRLLPVESGCGDPEKLAEPAPDTRVFRLSLRLPAEPCLFFYWFEIDTASGRFFYTADRENLAGRGQFSPTRPHYLPGEAHFPAAWQVTVYAADFQEPDWLTGSVIYQIFPDRFNRDAGFTPDRFQAVNWPERIWHEDWQDDVDIHGRPETGYLACDFYGGTLAGICEKLDYLAAMGVKVLYLNPIFQARSNHRYDTGDYENIDPLLGTTEDFQILCREALARGIRIMLDGVFSHTGADSRYFNKFGRYHGAGAWQEVNGQGLSPYSSWYGFHQKGDQVYYDSWWGFEDLPSVNENDLAYRDYIIGPQGIVRHWLKLGASGWRLDVSDELPDSFLRDLRLAVKQEKPDAVIMGEVWEDASQKISYGYYRDFLLGRTHDLVMGYPFQQALTGWLSGHFPAERMHHLLETLRENYPLPTFYSSFNLISSHDIPRAITTMAGLPDPGNREAQARIHLSASARQRGEALLRLAVLFQMAYPGCPVIYYGDETAMEGYRDPFNRRTFPWGKESKAMQQWFAALGQLRLRLPVLRTGTFAMLLAAADCAVFSRELPDGCDIFDQLQEGPRQVLLAINRSPEPRQVQLEDRLILLPGFGGWLEIDGRQVLSTDLANGGVIAG